MTPDKVLQLKPFDFLEIRFASITLTEFLDEGEMIYAVTLIINIEDGSKEGHFLAMQTGLHDPCKLCAALNGTEMLLAMGVSCNAKVMVTDTQGELLSEFDLNNPPDHLNPADNTEVPEQRILH